MATLRQPQHGFWKSIAGSLAFHAIVISAALFVYKGEPKVFFTPAYTVDLVGRPAVPSKKEEPRPKAPPQEELPQKEEPVKAESPRQEPPPKEREIEKRSEPKKTGENTVKLRIKEEAKKEDVSEALSRIKENVRKKDDQEALSSSIERIKKKKELEAKENAKKLDELRKRLLAREGSQKTQPPAASPGAPGPARTDMESKYPAYYGLIRDKVQANWTGLEEYGENISVIVSIKIARNGQLVSSWVEKSSGNQRFDKSLLNAIKKASPFPPLPHEFDGDYLETGFRFCPNCPV